MKLIVNQDACNACRMCEVACSFHHRGTFGPDGSSVKVASDFREGKIRVSIDSTCDLCEKESQPLCVQYCFTGALKKEAPHERT